MGGLLRGDLRLLDDLSDIDDRGLELALAILHRQRHRDTHLYGAPDVETLRAIDALEAVRKLTKRGA